MDAALMNFWLAKQEKIKNENRDSPQYRIHYYQKFTDACYEIMQQLQQYEPNTFIVVLWNNLDEQGRQNLLKLGMKFLKFNREQDLDQEDAVIVIASRLITDIENVLKSSSPKDMRLKKSQAPKTNALLRKAIMNHHLAFSKEPLPPKEVAKSTTMTS